MDNITLQRIQILHPKIRNEVAYLIEKANAQLTKHSQIRVVQGYRTFAEQQALYDQGRTKPGPKVTNAKPGQSFHNYGLAIDFALLIDGKQISWDIQKDWDGDLISDWLEVVKVFKEAGYVWGGQWKFKDNPHFEKAFSYTWQQLLEKYKKKDFIPGTNYLNL